VAQSVYVNTELRRFIKMVFKSFKKGFQSERAVNNKFIYCTRRVVSLNNGHIRKFLYRIRVH
jgi:hypothetical protein